MGGIREVAVSNSPVAQDCQLAMRAVLVLLPAKDYIRSHVVPGPAQLLCCITLGRGSLDCPRRLMRVHSDRPSELLPLCRRAAAVKLHRSRAV